MSAPKPKKPTFPVNAIVAMDEMRTIGKAGGLPWHLPQDLKRFSALTRGQTVLMGRKTFDSLPEKFKPLPHRLNLVLSRTQTTLEYQNTKVFPDLEQVLSFCEEKTNFVGETLWIIGGEQVYKLSSALWDKVYLTKVLGDHKGDAFFPEFERDFELIQSDAAEDCIFEVYQRRS